MLPSEDKTFYLELLRAYFDSANDAIFVLCDEMKFLLCNRAMETWLGKSELDLTRHNERISITRFFRESKSEQAFLSRFAQALEGRPGRFDCLLQPPHGTPRWVGMHLNKVALEHGQMVIGIARDITHERRDQVAMLKLSSAIEQTADSVMITDLNGFIEYVNPAFEQTTGFGREEALGGNPRLVKSGQHNAAFYKKLWRTILRGEVFRARGPRQCLWGWDVRAVGRRVVVGHCIRRRQPRLRV
jgi:PAS domain S-box-containing protein